MSSPIGVFLSVLRSVGMPDGSSICTFTSCRAPRPPRDRTSTSAPSGQVRMRRGQMISYSRQFPCESNRGVAPSDGRIGKVTLLAGTPRPGTLARLTARASTVIGETLPVGPGLTQNQYLESHSQGG